MYNNNNFQYSPLFFVKTKFQTISFHPIIFFNSRYWNNDIFLYHNPLFIFLSKRFLSKTRMSGIIIVELRIRVVHNELSAVSVSNFPDRIGSFCGISWWPSWCRQRRRIGALTDSVNFTHRLTKSVYWLFRSVN